jgi:hypothetical protein
LRKPTLKELPLSQTVAMISQIVIIAKWITLLLKEIFKWTVIILAIAGMLGFAPAVAIGTRFIEKIETYVRLERALVHRLGVTKRDEAR